MFAAGRVLGKGAAAVARVERRPRPAAAGVVTREGIIAAGGVNHRGAARVAQRDVVLEGHRHRAADGGKGARKRPAGRGGGRQGAGGAAGSGADQRDELHVGRQHVAQIEGGHALSRRDLRRHRVAAREVGAGGGFVFRTVVGFAQGEEGGSDAVARPGAQGSAGIVAAVVIERVVTELIAAARLDGKRRAQVCQVAHGSGHIHHRRRLVGGKRTKGQAQSNEGIARITTHLQRGAGIIHHIGMIDAGHAAGTGEGENGGFHVNPQIRSTDKGQPVQRRVGVLVAVCPIGGDDQVNDRSVAGDGIGVVEGNGKGNVFPDEGGGWDVERNCGRGIQQRRGVPLFG